MAELESAPRRYAGIAAALLFAFGVAACDDDSSDTSDAGATDTEETASEGGDG